MSQEEVKIEIRGEDEIVVNDSTTIRSKPLAMFLRHALDFLLGPRGGEVTVTRDYYDEHVSSYILSDGDCESSVYIGDNSIEVNGVEVKSKIFALLLRHALSAYFLTNGDGEVEIEEDAGKPVYYIRAKTLGG